MPSRTRNSFNWIPRYPRVAGNTQIEINEGSGLPLVLGDIIAGRVSKREYRVIQNSDGSYGTQRLDDGVPNSMGVARGGRHILTAEQTQRRLAAYERWKTQQAR